MEYLFDELNEIVLIMIKISMVNWIGGTIEYICVIIINVVCLKFMEFVRDCNYGCLIIFMVDSYLVYEIFYWHTTTLILLESKNILRLHKM